MHRRARKQAPRSVAQWLLPFSHYPRSSLPGWPRRPSRGQTGMRGVHPRRAHQFAPSPPEREQAEWRRLDRVRAGGYVRVQAVSLAWTEEVGGDRAVVSSAEGLAKCRRPGAGPQESWTIESARWHFLKRVCAHRPDLVDFVGAEVRHQQRLEAEGHRSFTWAVLKAAQALMGATAVQVVSLLVHAGPTCGWTARARFPICSHTRTLATTRSHARSHMRARTHATYKQGESALAALPCFEAAGRGATVLWGVPAAGPCVILADALSADDRHYLLPMLAQRTDWVVLATRPPSGAWAEELQKHKRVLRTGRHGRGARERGWWQRSCLTTRPLTSDVSCWVHQQAECAPHDLQLLHSALNSKRVRDIWLPCLEGAEASYWLGTEAGLMRAYHFRGQVAPVLARSGARAVARACVCAVADAARNMDMCMRACTHMCACSVHAGVLRRWLGPRKVREGQDQRRTRVSPESARHPRTFCFCCCSPQLLHYQTAPCKLPPTHSHQACPAYPHPLLSLAAPLSDGRIYCFRPHTIHSLRFVEPKFTTVATASPAASNALFSAADALSSSSCSAAVDTLSTVAVPATAQPTQPPPPAPVESVTSNRAEMAVLAAVLRYANVNRPLFAYK